MFKNIIRLFCFFSFLTAAHALEKIDFESQSIDFSKMKFPSNFLWGITTSEHQISGSKTCKNNNWAEWEKSKDAKGLPRIKEGQISKTSTDNWNLYRNDINLMQRLGVNAYKFSIEWSLVEPSEGVFDQNAISHYQNLIDTLLLVGITPMITLHHFTNPIWFQKLGSFEKEENIKYFVRFCTFIFEKFSDKVKFFCTINEPGIYALMGYVLGVFPPGETSLQKASEVIKNMLLAHCQVYKKLKAMKNGQEAQIGIVHNVLKFESYHTWNYFLSVPCNYLCSYFSHITSDCIVDFFKTGTYRFHVPLKAYTTFTEKFENPPLDFFGLDYYSYPLMSWQLSFSHPVVSCCNKNEVMADLPFRLYPEGIYKAIEEVSEVGVPIYITENAIFDNSGKKVVPYMNRYLYFVSKAIEDGYDIRGYFYRTLVDSFEWNEGFSIKLGLYNLDLNTRTRTMKEGAKGYQTIIQNWKKNKAH